MLLEAAAGDIEFKDGKFSVVGTDRAIAAHRRREGVLSRRSACRREFGVGLEAAGTFDAEPPNYPNGCHVCEVEIDPDTGVVDDRPLRRRRRLRHA